VKRGASLSLRLCSRIFLILLAGSLLVWSVFFTSLFFQTILERSGSPAEDRLGSVILQSIVKAPGGSLRFEPVAQLKQRMAEDVQLKILVWDANTCTLLVNSSSNSVSPLMCGGGVEIRNFEFRIRDDSGAFWNGFAMRRNTDAGTVIVAVWGGQFYWNDLLWSMGNFMFMPGGWYSLPVFAVAAALSWFTVRRGLEPLRELSKELNRVNLSSSNAQLSEEDIPVEVSPLVKALNGALARLDAGVARQQRFVANAAHEIRTPIAALRARLDNPRDEDLRKDLRRGLRRLQAISEQLLSSVKISAEEDAKAGAEATVDLTWIVRLKAADYAPLAVENGRRIEFDGPTSPLMVRGSRHAVDSIVSNLTDNALRAEPTGGSVIVRLREDAKLEVIDHGKGVAPEHRELIFEPFWRESDAEGGSGLGLAITRELVSKLGGRIWVEETPGGGATFKVSLRKCA
jgi:signal transduction histidine kinase